jgi:hypothetical protein
MYLNQYILGTIVITGCVIFHVIAILVLSTILKKFNSWFKKLKFVKKLIILVFSILYIIAVHMIEIVIWALIYLKIGEFEKMDTAIYFSTVTTTTLGYGDIVLSEKAQLLSGFEAIGGLILFGVSTALFIKLIAMFFETKE